MSPLITTCAGSSSTAPLFDPPRVASILAECVALDSPIVPRDVSVDRCWPVSDGGLLLQWSFELDSSFRFGLSGRLWGNSQDSAGRVGDALTRGANPRMTADGLRGVCVYSAELNCTVHSPDCDPFMPHLQACLNEDTAALKLAALGLSCAPGGDRQSSRLCIKLLGYKPGRRATIAYRTSEALERSARAGIPQRLVGKTYHDDRRATLADRHQRLAGELSTISGGRVSVPTPLGLVADLRMIVFECVSGEPIGGSTSPRSADVEGVVEALAALHQVSPRELPDFTLADECQVLRRWHDALAIVNPATAAQIEGLLECILQTADTTEPGPTCAIHRDFHESQLIVYDGRTTLLDLDTLSKGDACVDLGNFLAHLFLHTVRGGGRPAVFEQHAAATLYRYENARGGVARRNLSFYLASSLFRVGVVHGLRTQTRRYADAMWLKARDVLREMGGGG